MKLCSKEKQKKSIICNNINLEIFYDTVQFDKKSPVYSMSYMTNLALTQILA